MKVFLMVSREIVSISPFLLGSITEVGCCRLQAHWFSVAVGLNKIIIIISQENSIILISFSYLGTGCVIENESVTSLIGMFV